MLTLFQWSDEDYFGQIIHNIMVMIVGWQRSFGLGPQQTLKSPLLLEAQVGLVLIDSLIN